MKKTKFNGDRLRSARLYRAKTLAELADAISVSRQAVSQYENGDSIPESSKLFDIINYLKFPIEYFYQEDKNDIKTKTTYFRSLLKTNKKDRISQIKKISYFSLLYDFLSLYINFPAINLPERNNNNLKDIESVTQELRKHWGLSDEPISDMVYELERNGVIVTSIESTSSDIDAYSNELETKFEKNKFSKYIVVLSNNKKSKARRQFDCAHELGHIMLHNWDEDIETISRTEFNELENQADAFAAAFLLPKDAFLEDISKRPNNLDYYKKLKLKWNVSIGAMIIRAYKLGAITTSQYQYMMRQMAIKGWRKQEPYDDLLEIPEPNLMRNAVKILLKNKFDTGADFIKEFSNRYEIALLRDEIETLLNLEENTLATFKNNSISLELKK